MINKLKQLGWVGSSKKDLKTFPEEVQHEVGYALHIAQMGEKYMSAKPLKGLPGVMEIVSDYNTDTYRAVYTVNIKDTIYVLHAFQKKSKSGITTPKQEIDLIKQRLKMVKSFESGRK